MTRILRDKGAQNGCILAGENITEEEALEKARAFGGLNGLDLAKECCDPKVSNGLKALGHLAKASLNLKLKFHVVAYDYGVKTNILRMLADRGCKLTVVPAQTPAADVLALNPDGVFLSNGPGDPAACDYAIEAVKTIVEDARNLPVFGICLGHQILALASGAKTVKMPHGHHGANHPVQNIGNWYSDDYFSEPRLRGRCRYLTCKCESNAQVHCSIKHFKGFIVQTNQRSASKVTLKQVLVHMTAHHCSIISSNLLKPSKK